MYGSVNTLFISSSPLILVKSYQLIYCYLKEDCEAGCSSHNVMNSK